MSTTQNATEESTTNHAEIRFEVRAEWTRELNHPKDDAERLRERLSRIPVDGDVTVADMSLTGVKVRIDTDAGRMNHSPDVFAQKVQYVFRTYNSRTIEGDSVHSIPRSTPGLKPKHIRWAVEGRDRPTGAQHVPQEVWDAAQEKAEGLDLEGADAVEPTITTRTLPGAGVADE